MRKPLHFTWTILKFRRVRRHIPLIMNIYFNDNGNTRPVFRPCRERRIIVILSKLTANKRREGAEGALFRGNYVPFFSRRIPYEI